jgi:glucose/arabinose dehydrogenase
VLITEKPGRLRIYAEGKLSEPIGGVPKVEYRGQGGLLDVALDPEFSRNGFIYLSYTEAAEQQPPDARDPGDPRLGQFQDLDDNVLKGGAVARGRLDGRTLRDVE